MAEDARVISEKARDHYEAQVKSANYLLVAHAAGLVGCLSVLKDYATTPQLKGMGTFIVLFGVGLLGAILNYVSIAFSVMAATNRKDDFSLSGLWFAINLTIVGAAGGLIGLALLVAAIVVIIARFSSL